MESIGLEWPYSYSWLIAGVGLYFILLFWHARCLFKASTAKDAWKLIILRGLFGLIFLILITRPFIESKETNPDAVRLVAAVDLSGSMNHRDQSGGKRRIDLVRSFLDPDRTGSWFNQTRESFGAVDRLGFSIEDISAIRSSSWSIPESGENTALGDALIELLERQDKEAPGAVVLFSDGRNNVGKSPLIAGDQYRNRGIPINVIGVGEAQEQGNLSVSFSEVPSEIVAKEELILAAEINNGFGRDVKLVARLFAEEEELEDRSITLQAGESRLLNFSPVVPEIAGVRTYRVVLDSVERDSDPSDNSDAQVIQILPPAFFSALYLSHQINPLYPFLKRSLASDRFQLSSLIRLGEKTFHARGEKLSPKGYPQNPAFWMDYDVVLLDAGCLKELNSTMISSLKDFVQKRGGGLLLFGEPSLAREILGGVMPAVDTQSSRGKQNLSLSVLPEPLFSERKRLDNWKTFLPAGLPAHLITRVNPAAREVVSLKGRPDLSVMALQAYGAGKSAYWGSTHDWRRALSDEERSREFSLFWQGVVEWLGSGTVERIKVEQTPGFLIAGDETSLRMEALGADFEPSMDARVEANITGPEGFSKTLQLYPQGGDLGTYAGKFIPPHPGPYRVVYNLGFPDGEKIEQSSYLKIRQFGDEAKDMRYAERDLQMLANLTGGSFVRVEDMTDTWVPNLSAALPTINKRNDLANAWPLFAILFLAAGVEWVLRRKGGLR